MYWSIRANCSIKVNRTNFYIILGDEMVSGFKKNLLDISKGHLGVSLLHFPANILFKMELNGLKDEAQFRNSKAKALSVPTAI